MASGLGVLQPPRQSGSPVGSLGPSSSPVANPVGSQPVGGGGNAQVSNALNQALQHLAQPPTPVQITPPPQLSNNAVNNPTLQAALEDARRRAAQLAAREGTPDPFQLESINNVRKRLSQDNTEHVVDKAVTGIRASNAGMQTALDQQNARRGLGGGPGLAQRGATSLTEAGERNAARAESDIRLGREGQLDALTLGAAGIYNAPSQYNLGQTGLTNQAQGLYQGAAGALAGQNLAQQNYGLNQWQAAQNAGFQAQNLQQQQQMMQWNQLASLLGLVGGFA